MKSYEQVMELTRLVSAPAAFEDECCKLFYDTLYILPYGSTIVEVGCEYGRSSSIIGQIADTEGHKLTFIDPFVDPVSAVSWFGMMRNIGVPFTLHNMTTEEVVQRTVLPEVIDFLFIDGDHSKAGVTIDCQVLLPKVKRGGFACFHDFGRGSLKEVKEVVDMFMDSTWEQVGLAGTLGVWKRK